MRYWRELCAIGIAMAIIGGGCIVKQNDKDEKNVSSSIPTMEYSNKLFDDSIVHTINIDISKEDWEDLLANPTEENFYSCDLTIDGEIYNNVGIRTKGNSSLTQVASSDSDRYSFKVNFGKYNKEQNYYGLDKFVLNNQIQDATLMKDYLSYKLMGEFGVPSPEVSYSYITINGEEWGLYLNVEDIDKSFLERNYGENYGNLYKPSSDDMMGGAMKGERPDEEFAPGQMQPPVEKVQGEDDQTESQVNTNVSENTKSEEANRREATSFRGGNSNGADLKYTDDNYDSYSAIFDNAKTDIEDADKDRLIASLKQLSEGTNLDEVVNIEEVLRYFVVHNFVDNYDSYTGSMLHNYYLYEENGKLSMLPWDYNLGFGAFSQGGNRDHGMGQMPNRQGRPDQVDKTDQTDQVDNIDQLDKTDQIDQADKTDQTDQVDKINQTDKIDQIDKIGQIDRVSQVPDQQGNNNASTMVNMAIDTPLSGAEEADRPMWTKLINDETYKAQYHELFNEFLANYIENGKLEKEIDRVVEMISPYAEKDPTAFYTYDAFQKAADTLKTFVSLRGKSIRAQLSGEIPSTTEEQNNSEGSLIDASSINLSDMGSHGGGREPNGGKMNKQPQEESEEQPAVTKKAATQ